MVRALLTNPFRSFRSRHGAVALAPLLLAAGAAAQIDLNAGPPMSVFSQFPYAIALGRLPGPSLSIAAASMFPFGAFPTGTDVWTPGAGQCPNFAGPGAQTFTLPMGMGPWGFPTAFVLDVAVADPDNVGGDNVCSLVTQVMPPAFYVEVHGGISTPSVPMLAQQLLATDFDADGAVDDLLVLDSSGNVWLSNSGAPFAVLPAPAPPVLAPSPMRMALGSWNGDDLPDLVVTWLGPSPRATVLRNVGAGSLVAYDTVVFPPTAWPGCVTVADFDRDGADDFVVLDGWQGSGSNQGWVCRNNRAFPWPAATTFLPPVLLNGIGTALFAPTAVTCGDYDRDGDIDLVYASTDGNLYARPNDGNGDFPNSGTNLEVSWPSASAAIFDLETGDVDDDGDLDVVSCDWNFSGALKLWCNQLPTGRCTHELRAGLPDALIPEFACPRPALSAFLAPVKKFDVPGPGLPRLAHTFEDLPPRLCAGTLTIAWTPVGADRLYLDLVTPAGNFALDVAALDADGTVRTVIDLANLPGGLNLLPKLSKAGYLDVGGAATTEIHWMRLDLKSFCEHGLPGPTVDYWHTDLQVTGGVLTFAIDAPAAFAFGYGFVAFGSGIGSPDLTTPYEGVCLLPNYFHIAMMHLDAAGDGTLQIVIPGVPPCLHLHSQAIAVAANLLPPYGWSKSITDYTK